MSFSFQQTAPDTWEVWQKTHGGTSVYTFDRCVINYHRRLNPQLVRLERYSPAGRIMALWRRAAHFRGKPNPVEWAAAHSALTHRLGGPRQ